MNRFEDDVRNNPPVRQGSRAPAALVLGKTLLLGLFGTALLNACGSDPDDDAPPVCDEVMVLERTDLNGGRTLAAGCYAIEQRLSVSEGNLVLEPGVSITFSQDAGLSIEGGGSLTAVGAADERIFLTGAEAIRGFWRGLHFNGSNSPDNKLEHVVLSHAGSGKWHGGDISKGGIFVQGASNRLHIANATFTHNAQAAIVVESAGVDFKLDKVAFDDNEAPLWVHANLVGKLSDLSFSGNERSYIRTGLNSSGENVADPQTWAAFDVPYRVSNTLRPKATLTLQPGVTLEFEQDKGLEIEGTGRLNARGTEEAKIRFTGAEKQRGFWRGLYFYETRSSDNVLDHVIVEYAGSGKWHGGDSRGGIYVRGGGVALGISNSLFADNSVAGLFIDNGNSDVSVASTAFENNELPVWTAANSMGTFSGNNTFSENDKQWVLVGRSGGSESSDVTSTQTWAALPVPYRLNRIIRIPSGSDLSIAPGTTLEFNQDTGINVEGGTLSADASDGERIRFIAADGENVHGYWRGLFFQATISSKNVIANADILHAGGGKWHGGNNSQAGVFLYNKSTVNLSNVTVAKSGKYGLSVDANCSIDPCTGVTLSDNKDSDLFGNTGTCE